MKFSGKTLLLATPLAWFAGCSIGPLPGVSRGVGHHEPVISLQPTHYVLPAQPAEDGVLLAAIRRESSREPSAKITLLEGGISTAESRVRSNDPQADRLIQLTALRRRFSRSSTTAQSQLPQLTEQVESDAWNQIYQGRRNRRRQRSEAKISRPDKAALAEIERIESAASEEAARIEQAAKTEAEIIERRLAAEAALAERVATAQAKLAERLADAQEKRDLRVEAAKAERDLRMSFLALELDDKSGESLTRKLQALTDSVPVAKSATSKPSGLSRVANLFRGHKDAEPATATPAAAAGSLIAKAAGSAAASPAKSVTAAAVSSSLASAAALPAPLPAPMPATSLAQAAAAEPSSTGKIEFSFPAAPVGELKSTDIPTPTETLHPSLLTADLSIPAPAAAETSSSATESEPISAPAMPSRGLLSRAAGENGSASTSHADAAKPSSNWVLGRADQELVSDASSSRLFPVTESQESRLLPGPVDMTPAPVAASESSSRAFPEHLASSAGRDQIENQSTVIAAETPETRSVGSTFTQPGGMFADAPRPVETVASNSLLNDASPGLLAAAFRADPEAGIASTATFPVVQPAPAFPQQASIGPSLTGQPIAQQTEIREVPRPISQMPRVEKSLRLIDVCGPLSPSLESLVLQLDIPEAGIRKDVLAELASLGETARSALPAVQVLLDDDPLIAAHAAWTMWKINGDDKAVVQELVRLMQCGRTDVIQFAAYSLGSMEANALSGDSALRVERERQSGVTRLHIAEALTRIDAFDAQSVEVLIEGLSSTDESERWLAAIALGQVKDRHSRLVVPALTTALRDPNPEVRSASALSLGGFGKAAETAVAELQNRATLDAPGVREAAATALACIQQQPGTGSHRW